MVGGRPRARATATPYIDSLAIVKQLDFDVLVPSFATAGRSYDTVGSRAAAERHIDAIIERLRRGENH